VNGAVTAIARRWGRITRRGRVIRCQRDRSTTGPILYPSRAVADGAAADLRDAGYHFVPVACERGRHWHLRPVETAKEVPRAGGLSA
jgi:hypothetical protein